MPKDTNLFLVIAQAMWSSGEDGEVVAMGLAEALRWCIQEGTLAKTNVLVAEEFKLLLFKVDRK